MDGGKSKGIAIRDTLQSFQIQDSSLIKNQDLQKSIHLIINVERIIKPQISILSDTTINKKGKIDCLNNG